MLEGDNGKDFREALEKLTPDESGEFLYQEFVRKNHAKRISHWIQGQDAPQYGKAKDAVAAVNNLLAGLEPVVLDQPGEDLPQPSRRRSVSISTSIR